MLKHIPLLLSCQLMIMGILLQGDCPRMLQCLAVHCILHARSMCGHCFISISTAITTTLLFYS
jgi:hypothetical protein